MTVKNKLSTYDRVANQILAALDEGVIPWQQPWASPEGQLSLSTGKAYRGINPFLLGVTAMSRGYENPYWLTYKQAQQRGGQVRKGEKATTIMFWKRVVAEEDGEDRSFMVAKTFSVFNAEQCDNVATPEWQRTGRLDFRPIEKAETIVANMPNAPKIHDGGSAAYYRPGTDSVHMPDRDRFVSADSYYQTLFHELGHATGHKSRLNREGVTGTVKFGSGQYGREELIAEFSAAFVGNVAGLDLTTIDRSAGYIESWKKTIRATPKMVVQAASKAQAAADYIRGIEVAA